VCWDVRVGVGVGMGVDVVFECAGGCLPVFPFN